MLKVESKCKLVNIAEFFFLGHVHIAELSYLSMHFFHEAFLKLTTSTLLFITKESFPFCFLIIGRKEVSLCLLSN